MATPVWGGNRLGLTVYRWLQLRTSSLFTVDLARRPLAAMSPPAQRLTRQVSRGTLKSWAEEWDVSKALFRVEPGAVEHQGCQNAGSLQAEGHTPILPVCWMYRFSKWIPSLTLPLSTLTPSPTLETPPYQGSWSPTRPHPVFSLTYTPHLQSQPPA